MRSGKSAALCSPRETLICWVNRVSPGFVHVRNSMKIRILVSQRWNWLAQALHSLRLPFRSKTLSLQRTILLASGEPSSRVKEMSLPLRRARLDVYSPRSLYFRPDPPSVRQQNGEPRLLWMICSTSAACLLTSTSTWSLELCLVSSIDSKRNQHHTRVRTCDRSLPGWQTIILVSPVLKDGARAVFRYTRADENNADKWERWIW